MISKIYADNLRNQTVECQNSFFPSESNTFSIVEKTGQIETEINISYQIINDESGSLDSNVCFIFPKGKKNY